MRGSGGSLAAPSVRPGGCSARPPGRQRPCTNFAARFPTLLLCCVLILPAKNEGMWRSLCSSRWTQASLLIVSWWAASARWVQRQGEGRGWWALQAGGGVQAQTRPAPHSREPSALLLCQETPCSDRVSASHAVSSCTCMCRVAALQAFNPCRTPPLLTNLQGGAMALMMLRSKVGAVWSKAGACWPVKAAVKAEQRMLGYALKPFFPPPLERSTSWLAWSASAVTCRCSRRSQSFRVRLLYSSCLGGALLCCWKRPELNICGWPGAGPLCQPLFRALMSAPDPSLPDCRGEQGDASADVPRRQRPGGQLPVWQAQVRPVVWLAISWATSFIISGSLSVNTDKVEHNLITCTFLRLVQCVRGQRAAASIGSCTF